MTKKYRLRNLHCASCASDIEKSLKVVKPGEKIPLNGEVIAGSP